jgi:hypothetical protein
MKTRASKFFAIGVLLVVVSLPIVASAASRDQVRPEGRFTRIIRIVKKILKATPLDEVPSIPKP